MKNKNVLNSGRLEFGKKQTVRNEKKDIIDTKFNSTGFLYYQLLSLRQSDMKLYFGLDEIVDLKVKVYNVKDFDKTNIIKIDNKFYDIKASDLTPDSRFRFLYLVKRNDL